MKTDFIQETVQNDDVSQLLECLTGWEAVVFQLEDEEVVTLSEAKGL